MSLSKRWLHLGSASAGGASPFDLDDGFLLHSSSSTFSTYNSMEFLTSAHEKLEAGLCMQNAIQEFPPILHDGVTTLCESEIQAMGCSNLDTLAPSRAAVQELSYLASDHSGKFSTSILFMDCKCSTPEVTIQTTEGTVADHSEVLGDFSGVQKTAIPSWEISAVTDKLSYWESTNEQVSPAVTEYSSKIAKDDTPISCPLTLE
ncbi:uncharacterized protein LOC122817375 [Protopterus annectens]|uniref:uncharacterized protein LOC122817375 n=1 Tax=Protopterus annectens TaxID=7888 RepID=UPI001CF94CFF|nr:uncharacterized protein LOC122817375 [Protopterus annectens]